jgi:DNA-binding Xre family transcriptional regulator
MPQKAYKSDFTALIDTGGQLYRADSLNQLETFILAFEPKEKTIQAKQNDMKAKIICRTLDEVRENIFALCKEYGVKADRVFLPGNFDNTNNMGIAYAVNDKNVVAASPYWRMEDGLIELQADLLKVSKMICTAPLSPKKDAVSELEAESEGSFKGENAGTAHNEEKPSKMALLIKERGLTVTEVAKRMGVFPTSLSRIIHNGTNRQSTLKSIAEAIGCNIEDLKD